MKEARPRRAKRRRLLKTIPAAAGRSYCCTPIAARTLCEPRRSVRAVLCGPLALLELRVRLEGVHGVLWEHSGAARGSCSVAGLRRRPACVTRSVSHFGPRLSLPRPKVAVKSAKPQASCREAVSGTRGCRLGILASTVIASEGGRWVSWPCKAARQCTGEGRLRNARRGLAGWVCSLRNGMECNHVRISAGRASGGS